MLRSCLFSSVKKLFFKLTTDFCRQRSSVLQSVRHNEKQGSQPKRNRKTKYVKRKDDQIFDGMSSGSGSDSRLSEGMWQILTKI